MFRIAAGLLGFVLLLPFTVAAETPALSLQNTQRQGGGTERGFWLDVPFVRQEKDGCGAAAIAMVMQYWKQHGQVAHAADPLEVQRALFSKEAHGIYASAMQHYLEAQGFQTFAFAGTETDLRHHLEKGRPLIVALEPANASPLHYVVVVGMDDARGLALVNDPAQKKLLKVDQSSFEREWDAAGKWTLLAVPQSGTH